MTVSSLKKHTNCNIRLEFVDRDTREVINIGELNRKDMLDFICRKVYMIFPTEEKDVLKVLLY